MENVKISSLAEAVSLDASDVLVGNDGSVTKKFPGSLFATSVQFEGHVNATDNPHIVTATQVGLGSVDNVSASDLRDRSTHTGTQTLSTISDAGTIASQDADSVTITGGSVDATVSYDNAASGLSATNVKDAIDEVTEKTVEIDALADQRLREAFRKEKSTDVAPSLLLDFAGDKQLDPRVTYTRASTATYYDGQTVAKAEENLVLNSQDFDQTGWLNVRLALSSDATNAPDGTNTAYSLTQQSNETEAGYVTMSPVPLVEANSTWSFYAKPNGKNFVYIETDNSPMQKTWFDISNGTVETTNANHSASIVNAGNGWYRCIVTSSAIGERFTIAVADTDNSLTVVDSGGVYLWGAQLEQRDSVTAYTVTTTQPVTNYIPVLQTAPSGEPRFDHDPVTGESKGFLTEGQITNLSKESEDFNSAEWDEFGGAIVNSAIVAPDGTLTGSQFIEDTNTSNHPIAAEGTNRPAATGDRTISAYFKQSGNRYVVIAATTAGNWRWSVFDLQDGVISQENGTNGIVGTYINSSIEPVGNGWYRCSLSINLTAPLNIRFTASSGSTWTNTQTYTGDGYSGFFIWGVQQENNPFPTSYIKTEGSQVTRAADDASMNGTNFSDWYRQDEGTFYADISRGIISSDSISTANTGTFSLTDGTGSNNIASWRNLMRVYSSGNLDVNFNIGTNPSYVFALGLKLNDCAVSLDGASVLTDNSVVLPRVNSLRIGAIGPLANYHMNGHIKKIAYYPVRLADATLESITT